MTKVIIIGQEPKQEKKLKPIEFLRVWDCPTNVERAQTQPIQFKNIELIAKGYFTGLDLMFAYDESRASGQCVIGHFNDGVVS